MSKNEGCKFGQLGLVIRLSIRNFSLLNCVIFPFIALTHLITGRWQERHLACKNYCHKNSQRFSLGDWANLE